MHSLNFYVHIVAVQMHIEMPCVIVANFCELELYYISHHSDNFLRTIQKVREQ